MGRQYTVVLLVVSSSCPGNVVGDGFVNLHGNGILLVVDAVEELVLKAGEGNIRRFFVQEIDVAEERIEGLECSEMFHNDSDAELEERRAAKTLPIQVPAFPKEDNVKTEILKTCPRQRRWRARKFRVS